MMQFTLNKTVVHIGKAAPELAAWKSGAGTYEVIHSRHCYIKYVLIHKNGVSSLHDAVQSRNGPTEAAANGERND